MHVTRVDNFRDIVNLVGMNRLTIEIEPEQHRRIKTLASFAGMTIKDFILSKTLAPTAGQSAQDDPDTTETLLASPENARRLRDAIGSKTPEHLVFETTEDLKRALGI